MNNKLIASIANQARANVELNKTTERFDEEFARLFLTEVLYTASIFDASLIGSDYSQGLLDAQTQIENAIKIKFGVK